MRVLLRADAGPHRGTGHVMRCLTLAEALVQRGSEVAVMGSVEAVPWLERHLAGLDLPILTCAADELDADRITAEGYDRVVVDSYSIDPAAIARLDALVPCLAIIDNESRGISASLYLDQNLGAETRSWPENVASRLLAGSRYALIRDAVVAHRREDAWVHGPGRSRVVAFMGGSDPQGVMTEVARSIAAATPDIELHAIVADALVPRVREAVRGMAHAVVLAPTDDLPALLGRANVVVSAAGTSAWDVCSMGRPAVLVAVAGNQSESLARALNAGVAIGVDATTDGVGGVGTLLAGLLANETARRDIARRGLEVFDGRGKHRVAEALAALSPTAE